MSGAARSPPPDRRLFLAVVLDRMAVFLATLKGDVAVEGDPNLINRYDAIELNPAKHADAKLAAAHLFADWLVSAEGRSAIGAYRVGDQQVFNPSADHPK